MIDAYIIYLAKTYGIGGAILFLVGIGIFKKFDVIWLYILKSLNKEPKIKGEDNHAVLLSRIDHWLNFSVHNLKVDDPGKRLMFSDLLKIRFTTIHKHLSELRNKPLGNVSAANLYTEVTKCMHDCIEEAEALARTEGIPELIIEKYRIYSAKNIEFALRAIEMVCYAQFYNTNSNKLQAIYSLITAMLELNMTDVERSIGELNGQLCGTMYKGIEVCGCGKNHKHEH